MSYTFNTNSTKTFHLLYAMRATRFKISVAEMNSLHEPYWLIILIPLNVCQTWTEFRVEVSSFIHIRSPTAISTVELPF